MTHQSSVVHSTFSIERTYPVSASRVFAAFSNPATKRRWFAEGEGWEVEEFTVDFREGGNEFSRFRFKGGPEIRNYTTYQDIVPDQRIVLVYSMTVGEKRLSASLATVEIVPAGNGTRLTYTEQGAFFDGADMPKAREEGCRALFEALAEELRKTQ
ncbi:SRPBCC family protein [Hyalangium sp.]|uniref:SRPBCC family protein n=1 Tax=Hyalangium sp. TaxID=2028555 RepID=UPI002D66CAE1|nr:SRPBCC family protein [Hyalangium sp.]HYI00698.1 SRPBCC family protein [Hyalangium sp.]